MHVKRPVNFKRTDEMNSLVRDVVEDYHQKNDIPHDRKLIRKRSKEMLLAIEAGMLEIPLHRVRRKKKAS